jgi:hypothetical protein
MTGDIWEEWMKALNKDMRKKNRKVLLIIDNASSHHRELHLDHVQLAFLPPNVTSKIQPMDQGIIQNTKVLYRTAFLKKIILNIEAGQQMIDFSFTLLNALHVLAASWRSVSAVTIQNCFRKAGWIANDGVSIEEDGDNNHEVNFKTTWYFIIS